MELNVQGHLVPEGSQDEFHVTRSEIEQCPLPCSAANCFVPGHLKITGPDADLAALESYVKTACERAEQVGIQAIVFGSGGARAIPEGVARDTAYRQLLDFGRMTAPIAEQHNIVIVVEPLNTSECNVFTSVRECGDYVRDVGHPAIRLLVDGYHVAKDNDNLADITAYGSLIRHVHLATYASRRAPGLEECDFGPFLRALKDGGYAGRISIEGGWDNVEENAKQAYAVLAESWKQA